MNWDAQILQRHEAETMKNSPEIMERVLRSYRLILGFYGAELVDEATGELRRADNYVERFDNLNRFGHNYLRITRILKFLGEMGLERLKLPFLTFFVREVAVERRIPNCRRSLESFWIPTLRSDDELIACLRYLHDPRGPPPTAATAAAMSVGPPLPALPAYSAGALAGGPGPGWESMLEGGGAEQPGSGGGGRRPWRAGCARCACM